MPTTQSTEE
ncbi:hypothetical protein CFP56_027596 [Quercus suber]|uniref:Uncharacterized protein n=1 Tax=Quercus suber TaxID=58331 RepID=A0AAW0JWW8_QUESU